MNINKTKYREAILYLCSKLEGSLKGKKKLAKLLYYLDFDFYEKNYTSITGETYKALPMGPFPIHLDDVIEEMVKEKQLSLSKEELFIGYLPTEVYTCHTKFNPKTFSKDEQKMLDRVFTKYGHLNGKQLEELTHAEAPYLATKPKDEIAYELSFYRGTDFNND